MGKAGFLAGLADPANTSQVLTTTIRHVRIMGSQAFVEALVRLEGTRRGKPVEGTFRNLRLFERQVGGWCCVAWSNQRVDEWETASLKASERTSLRGALGIPASPDPPMARSPGWAGLAAIPYAPVLRATGASMYHATP